MVEEVARGVLECVTQRERVGAVSFIILHKLNVYIFISVQTLKSLTVQAHFILIHIWLHIGDPSKDGAFQLYINVLFNFILTNVTSLEL